MPQDSVTPIKELIVVAGLIRIRDRILIAQRKSDSKIAPDIWEFPGGKRDEGETDAEAMIREIDEELNLKIRVIGEYMEEYPFDYETEEGIVRVWMRCLECVSDSEEFELKDVQDARLIEVRELGDYEFAPADEPIVEKVSQK